MSHVRSFAKVFALCAVFAVGMTTLGCADAETDEPVTTPAPATTPEAGSPMATE